MLAAAEIAEYSTDKDQKLTVKEQSSENNSGVNRSPNLTEQSCESEVALAAEDEIQDHGENSTTLSSIDNI